MRRAGQLRESCRYTVERASMSPEGRFVYVCLPGQEEAVWRMLIASVKDLGAGVCRESGGLREVEFPNGAVIALRASSGVLSMSGRYDMRQRSAIRLFSSEITFPHRDNPFVEEPKP
jgi:hypothetical protein